MLRLGETTVRFHDWVSKPGDAGEFLGFSLTIDGPTFDHYIVKAGTQKYIADGAGWMYPAGANAAAISNVDFCECEPPPPSCDNPDGCDDGGGDGDGTIL